MKQLLVVINVRKAVGVLLIALVVLSGIGNPQVKALSKTRTGGGRD